MSRIPLWVDLEATPSEFRDAVQDAAQQVGAERILSAQSDVHRIRIQDAASQQLAADTHGIVVVDCDDWTIIPLENLIAARRDRPGTLFAVARSPEEAIRFRHTLDVGVHGIVLATDNPETVQAVHQVLLDAGPRADDALAGEENGAWTTATITAIEDAGNGERVCIDCIERFQPGEGILIGSTATSFALVHAETLDSEYVNSRPFRVNAGAIHSYLLGPGGRTQYLSEVQAGHQILAVQSDGSSRTLTVGRAKIEHRPHTLIRWTGEQGAGSAALQTAETVRLVNQEGTPVAVTELQVGDTIAVQQHAMARHFGMPVKERLVER